MEGSVAEIEFAFVAEGQPNLDWSAVNRITLALTKTGIIPPIDLEDDRGEIKTQISSGQADQFADYLAENGSVYVFSIDNQKDNQESHIKAKSRLLRFVLESVRWFRTAAHQEKDIEVKLLPVSEVTLTLENEA